MEPISTLILSFAFLVPIPVTQRLILDKSEKDKYTYSKDMNDTELPLMSGVIPTTTDRTLYKPKSVQLVNVRELLKRETKAYSLFEAGWDEEGSQPPSKIAMNRALSSIDAIPARLPLPRPMLSSSGELGLYWDLDGGYAELSFETNGQMSFFSRKKNGQEIFDADMAISSLNDNWFWKSIGELDSPLRAAA
jgi:hypothetical protein